MKSNGNSTLPPTVVFAMRGTMVDLKGMFTDVLLNMNILFKRRFPSRHMVNLLGKIKAFKEAGNPVLITGHSLGGYLAEVASTRLNIPGVSFSGPGPDTWTAFHSCRWRNPDFHVLGGQFDPIINSIPRPRIHTSVPVRLHGLNSHSVDGLLAQLRGVRNPKLITNRNIVRYTGEGQRRRRASFILRANGNCGSWWCFKQCPRQLPVCTDSDVCVRAKWGGNATCKSLSTDCWLPEKIEDMVQCCPLECRYRGGTLDLAICRYV